MKIGYFPGCSLHGGSREYDMSTTRVLSALGVHLTEINDWSCCGATSAHSTNHKLATALAARNLSLAEAQGFESVLPPCAACYSRLASARHDMQKDDALAKQVTSLLERPFANSVGVLTILEYLQQNSEQIKARVTKPLAGMKVAAYYGCLLLRPAELVGYDDPEDPSSMENILRLTGADPVRWNMRMECCGGSLSISRTGSVIRLGRAIIESARAAGARAIIVACPMCQSNLDFRQEAMIRQGLASSVPILFITQILGLAFGMSGESLGLPRHFVSPDSLINSLSAAAQTAQAAPQGSV